MEVKMPYVKRMGLGGIMLEVIRVGCFWLLLADFKIGMVMGTIVTASVIMMSVIDQVIYHKYKIPITKEIVEREHQIILYGSASRVEVHNVWNIFKKLDWNSKGGVLFLLNEGVYFREWRENNPYEIMIPYKDIKKIRRYVFALMDIKIYYGDEKCEKFTVYRSKIWTKKIREFMKEAQKDEEVSKR